MSKNLETLVWEAEQKWIGTFGEEDGTPDFLFLCDLISVVREEDEGDVIEVVLGIVLDEANADGEEYSLEQLAQIEEWVSDRYAEVK